jgi:hypothetical protein
MVWVRERTILTERSTGNRTEYYWILETLSPQEFCDKSVTDPTSTIAYAATVKPLMITECLQDGVTTIKPGHQKTGNTHVIWSGESSFTVFPASRGVYIWRTPSPQCLAPRLKHETGVLCGSLGSNVVPCRWSHCYPSMAELLQGSTWTGWVIRCLQWSIRYFRTIMQFSKTWFTQLKLFSHSLKSIKVNFNIFPNQYDSHTWTSLKNSDQLCRLELGRDSHREHMWSNLKTFFMENVWNCARDCSKFVKIPFREGLRLYWRHKVVQHLINKEMCTASVVFLLFWPTTVCGHLQFVDLHVY